VTAADARLAYTETEMRSLLPSGWSIAAGQAGQWDARRRSWSIEVQDGAANLWTVSVAAADAAADRLGAFRRQLDRLERKALGRKSILTG